MRIITTAAQIYRVANLDGGTGDYPGYPYGQAIPKEIGEMLLSCRAAPT